MISYILALLVSAGVLAFDQYTKFYIAANASNLATGKTFIPKLIDLIFVENDGGAWGMLGGYTWLLVSVTIVIMFVCVALLIRYGAKNKLMFWAICLVLSGGIGNMIDRVLRGGKVVDFLHFSFFKSFPVFNVADIAICVGAGLLILYFIFGMVNESRQKKEKRNEIAQNTNDNEI